MEEDAAPTIRDLYPDFTDAQLGEAEEKLEEYLVLVLRIYERICADPQAYAKFRRLTEKGNALTCKAPRRKALTSNGSTKGS